MKDRENKVSLAGRAREAGSSALALLAGVFAIGAMHCSAAAEHAVSIPPPATDIASDTRGSTDTTDTAVLAGGCFWGIQAVFQHTRGVISAVSGYAGGDKESASYPRVSTGTTKHAESVQITYDPKQISYGKLLQIYFSVAHDPTQLNRQYPDTGPQYRSAIFYRDPQQQRVAQQYIAQLDAARVYRSKIVTEVTPLAGYYPAEAYHQDYATLHPDSGYIARFDLPKIANLKQMFPDQFREDPVLVRATRVPRVPDAAAGR